DGVRGGSVAPDDESTSASTGTYTYRAYSSRRHLWAIQGINTHNAEWGPGLAWGDGSNRYLIQHYGSAIERIRYFAITPTSFLWRADPTEDGGKKRPARHPPVVADALRAGTQPHAAGTP